MPITVRQEWPTDWFAASSPTRASGAAPSACLIGSAIPVWVLWGGSTLPTVSDSASQSYLNSGIIASDSNDGLSLALFYLLNNQSNTALTVTATWGSAQTYTAIWPGEIAAATATAYQSANTFGQDQVAPGSGTGAITAGTNSTPTAQPALLYAIQFDDGGGQASLVAGGLTAGATGWLLNGSGNLPSAASGYQRLTSLASVLATFTNATDGPTRRFLTAQSVWTEQSSGNVAPIAWVQ